MTATGGSFIASTLIIYFITRKKTSGPGSHRSPHPSGPGSHPAGKHRVQT